MDDLFDFIKDVFSFIEKITPADDPPPRHSQSYHRPTFAVPVATCGQCGTPLSLNRRTGSWYCFPCWKAGKQRTGQWQQRRAR